MRENPSVTNGSVDHVPAARDSSRRQSKADAAASTGEAAAVTRSPELTRLLTLLKKHPEVRVDALNEVRMKIAAGELETHSAYAEAAFGVVDSQ